MAWFGFWIFLGIVVAVDAWLYSKGFDSFFFEDQTEDEKEIRAKQRRDRRV